MPTAILDLEYMDLPQRVDGLERYAQAKVLVRVAGRPAAWVHVPVEGGCVHAQKLLDAIRRQVQGDFWHAVAVARLGDTTIAPAVEPKELPSVTVAVCTRDRSDDLRRCLDSLDRLPDDGQEILVVDSASQSIEPRTVAEQFARVRYLRLERPGLNVARNAALAAATGEIVLFIDDDTIADVNWLRAHRQAFGHPLTMASTGLILPLELETEAQEQFEVYGGFSRGFTPRTFQSQHTHPLAAGLAGAGANMALRRSVVQRVGLFDEALDAGTPTQSGGECDLLARILAHDYRIQYTPAALNWHRHRRSVHELRRTVHGYGVGVYAFWSKHLLNHGEFGALFIAGEWFLGTQLPHLVRSLARRPGAARWPLPLDELRGCLAGPQAYLRAQHATRARRQQAGVHSEERDSLSWPLAGGV
jgi:glycosyltransferase involved in cell wall biosynthesis